MSVNQEIVNNNIVNKQLEHDKNKKVRFRGKNVEVKKIEKHVMHKPRLIGTLLANASIILVLIILILLFGEVVG